MLRVALSLLGVAAVALAPAAGGAAEEKPPVGSAPGAAASPSETPPVAAAPPLYQLPKVGKPRGRIGGGRRGPIGATADLHVLVPEHVGQTTSAQPTLYWYLAEPVQGAVAFELALIDATSVDPVADVHLERPASAGVQRVRLADLGVKLEPGQEYQWSIAVVSDPQDHSKDVVASGWIERVPPPEGMEERLGAAGPDGAAAVYGAAGLWYDTLDAAYERVRANPDTPSYRQQLAALLEEVGLPAAAADQPEGSPGAKP